jgi:hypothetical protein
VAVYGAPLLNNGAVRKPTHTHTHTHRERERGELLVQSVQCSCESERANQTHTCCYWVENYQRVRSRCSALRSDRDVQVLQFTHFGLRNLDGLRASWSFALEYVATLSYNRTTIRSENSTCVCVCVCVLTYFRGPGLLDTGEAYKNGDLLPLGVHVIESE